MARRRGGRLLTPGGRRPGEVRACGRRRAQRPVSRQQADSVWRRAGLEVEAIRARPSGRPSLSPTGLCGASRYRRSPVLVPAALQTGTLPGAHLQNCQLSDAHRAPLPVGGDGCVQKRERAIISLITHETHARSIV